MSKLAMATATHKSTDREVGGDPGYARALTVLVAWFFVAVWLGLSGALAGAPAGRPPAGLGAAIGIPLLVFALDARFGGPLSRAFARIELPALTALQTFRVGGVFFLIAYAQGALPAGFALPAGIGDIAIGIAAPFVAAALASRRRSALAVAAIWNVLGLVDLVTAVAAGVTHSSSAFGIFAGAVTTDRLARYPFSLIPTFLVPVAVILHGFSLRALARARAAR
jgi:hypothetical protein